MLKVKEFCLDSFTNLAFFVMFWNKSELSGWPSQPYFLSSKEVKQFHCKQKEHCICTGLHWFPIWRLSLIGDFLICSTNVGVFSVVSNMNSTKSRQLCGTFLESKEVFFVLYSFIHRDDVLLLPSMYVVIQFTYVRSSSDIHHYHAKYLPIQNTSS